MTLTRRIFAALFLCAWLGAGAHLALEHGGVAFCAHLEEMRHGGEHHDAPPASGEEDAHHHDFGALTAAKLAKSFTPQLAPCVASDARLLRELMALLRGRDEQHEHSTLGESPPDGRASGWLLVVQTARPVRGPSLAV